MKQAYARSAEQIRLAVARHKATHKPHCMKCGHAMQHSKDALCSLCEQSFGGLR